MMPVQPADLREEVSRLLHESGIYDVDTYGWSGLDDVDPEFVGYAMWTLDRPYEGTAMGRQLDIPPDRRPTDDEQRLVELGEDFEGLMKAARWLIGLALLYREDALIQIEPDPFEFHVLSATMTLAMASDRARDFVIVALLHEEPRFSHEGDQLRLALCEARRHGLEDIADPLDALRERIATLRSRRNNVVHKIALDVARMHKILIEEDRKAFDRKKWPLKRPKLPSGNRFWGPMTGFGDEAQAEIDDTVRELKANYEDVIKAGDLAFRLENRTRAREHRVRRGDPFAFRPG